MGLIDWLNSPYSAYAHKLRGSSGAHMRRATYKIVPGPHGMPMVQLDLHFKRFAPVVANPDMSLCVIMDRSGSMRETFAEGHVYNACSQILQYVSRAGVGYDMVFYDDRAEFAGHITNDGELRRAIATHQPRGGTTVTAAIKGAIQKYRKPNKGLYMIVVTDGEFSDKLEVERYVSTELLPQMAGGQNPYALRLHFVGAGHGVDHEFLKKMEDLATGQGVPLVTAHHHAHLGHSHDDVLDELEGAFLGIGTEAFLGTRDHVEHGETAHGHTIMHVGDVNTRRWLEGESAQLGFIPKRASLGLEFGPHHPRHIDLGLRYKGHDGKTHLLTYNVPLPQQVITPGSFRPGSWITSLLEQETPEQRAEREALEQRAQEVHEAELKRQAIDLKALGQGGIPMEAQLRLRELGQQADDPNAIFTSNLSPDEMALLRRNGYRARGMVMGSAMYHVGQAYASSQQDCEVTVLSEAYNHATQLAVSRLKQELKLIGAHGVVGVRLAMARHEWGEKSIEVQVLGTAIEGPGAAPQHPWLSDLSGQEWWALHRAGYEPAGLVWGHCTWFSLTTDQDEYNLNAWNNVEMTHWSDAVKQARNRAMKHLTQQAKDLGALGVTGVRFDRRIDEVRLQSDTRAGEREHHNLVLSVIGTAIKHRPGPAPAVPPSRLVISLRDGNVRSERILTTSSVATSEEL